MSRVRQPTAFITPISRLRSAMSPDKRRPCQRNSAERSKQAGGRRETGRHA